MNKRYKKDTPEYSWGGVMSGLSAGSSIGGSFGTIGSIAGGAIGALVGAISPDKEEEEKKKRMEDAARLMTYNLYSGATNPSQSMGPTVTYPYGGKVFNPNAEVEGGEVLKAPNGQVNTMQGPSHAQGGIDINAPQGTKVYSDRIKHKVGNKYETYAETAAKLNKILDKYKKVDKNEDTLKKNSDALMIARIQQKLDNLFDEQEMQKTAQGIEQPEQQTMAYGGTTGRPPFDEWYKTVPASKNDTNFYNLRRAYDLAPQDQLDAFVKDPNAHLYSAYENKETGVYEFMKKKNHPTLQKELDWYNSNDNEAVDFKNKYSLDTNGDYYKYVPKKKLMMDQSGPYNKKLEMNQTGPYYQKLMMDQKGPYNEKLMMEQRQIKNRQLMMNQTGPYYQKLMMDQTKRQINPSQLKFAYGGTTGWPPYKEYNPYTMNPSGIDIPIEEETDNIELSTYNNDLNFNIPKNKIYFTGRNAILPNNSSLNTAYNTGIMPTTTNKGFTPKYPEINGKYGKFMMFPNKNGINYDPNWYSPKVGKSFSDINNVPQIGTNSIGSASTGPAGNGSGDTPPPKDKKKTDWAGIGSTALEAAPMIYNLLQNKSEQTALAPLLNTNFMTPKMQEDAQQLREAERTYGAIINDQNKSTAERLQAARMLQAAKGQIRESTINKYRQDEMAAKQFNAEITNRNIAMGYQVGIDNAADRASIKNAQSQAMKDLSQLAQKRNLEGNMADKNEYLKNAVKSIYPEFEIKDDGTVVYAKTKAKLSDEDQQKYNALMAILYAMNNTSTGSNGIGSGYYGSMMSYQSNNPAVPDMYQKKNAGG